MATKTLTKKGPAKKAAVKKTTAKATTTESALVSKVAYFILYVPDMTKAVEFYKSIGLRAGFTSPEWSEFDAGIKFALHGPCQDSCGTYEASETNISFGVASCKATYETFQKMGVKVTSEPREVCENGYAFQFQDPFGNTLGVYGKL